MSAQVYYEGEHIAEVDDLEIVEQDEGLTVAGGYRRSAEMLIPLTSRRIYMPLQFLDSAGFEPRKPWVRNKDWEQRAPRRRRRR